MATSGSSGVKPDHVIIWCDRNMAVEGNNDASRAILNVNADVNRPESSEQPDINYFICNINPYLNKTKFQTLIRSPLRMFTNENECMKCINDNIEANKKVFLITSGQTGKEIIPEVYENLDVYQKLSGSTYVFCAQRSLHEQWTRPYEKDIEIYDDERGVFAKVLLDIGIYYLTKGQDEPGNPTGVPQYLYWARRLIQSATKVDGINRDDYLNCIRDDLSEMHAEPSDGYDSDTPMSVDADSDKKSS
jgi:hypothetical protein